MQIQTWIEEEGMLVETGGGVGVLVICLLEEICYMRKEASSSVEEELVGVSGS